MILAVPSFQRSPWLAADLHYEHGGFREVKHRGGFDKRQAGACLSGASQGRSPWDEVEREGRHFLLNFMKYGNILVDMYRRILNLNEILKHKSVFLFGPRQTGKTTLVRQAFPGAAFYALLEADTLRELSARPENLRQTLGPQQSLVVVDEIQKLPALLDEMQLLIPVPE